MVSGDGRHDVCEELLVPRHHFIIVLGSEVNLDHLLQGLEAPHSFLPFSGSRTLWKLSRVPFGLFSFRLLLL